MVLLTLVVVEEPIGGIHPELKPVAEDREFV
jgi:hypothetical protein